MVCSGGSALVFKWKGDALYTKRNELSGSVDNDWTTFIMPAREPYPVPGSSEFGSFLANSLTFTTALTSVKVFVDDVEVFSVSKTLGTSLVMVPPVANSFWKRNALVSTSPTGLFSLATGDGTLTETEVTVSSVLAGDSARSAQISARVITAEVKTRVAPGLLQRMERVTKKKPMKRFSLRVVLPGADEPVDGPSGDHRETDTAQDILSEFAPRLGAGRIYIGFRTQQTTGLAAHVQAPFLPTVEREAVDLVEPALKEWNTELLYISGVVLRLSLEHVMLSRIATSWASEEHARREAEVRRLGYISEVVTGTLENGSDAAASLSEGQPSKRTPPLVTTDSAASPSVPDRKPGRSLLGGLVSFMSQAASDVRRIAVAVTETVTGDATNLLEFSDPQPLSRAERAAIVLMRSFEPTRAAPDRRIGTAIARGFEDCLPNMPAPVLTTAGKRL